jgi:hypothetical protein
MFYVQDGGSVWLLGYEDPAHIISTTPAGLNSNLYKKSAL